MVIEQYPGFHVEVKLTGGIKRLTFGYDHFVTS